jgi:hypothetical protein
MTSQRHGVQEGMDFKEKRNLRGARLLVGDSISFWGAFTASELILFYYEKVNTKLKNV